MKRDSGRPLRAATLSGALPGRCRMLKDLLAEIEGEQDNEGAAKEGRNT